MPTEYTSKVNVRYRVERHGDKWRIEFYSNQRKTWVRSDFWGIGRLFGTEQLADDALQAYAERNGWTIIEEVEDHDD